MSNEAPYHTVLILMYQRLAHLPRSEPPYNHPFSWAILAASVRFSASSLFKIADM